MKPHVDLQVLYLLATTVTLFVLAAMAGFGLHARREAVGRAFAAVSASAACWTATVALLALAIWAYRDMVWLALVASIVVTLKSYLVALAWR